jgi:hypothetical protein
LEFLVCNSLGVLCDIGAMTSPYRLATAQAARQLTIHYATVVLAQTA